MMPLTLPCVHDLASLRRPPLPQSMALLLLHRLLAQPTPLPLLPSLCRLPRIRMPLLLPRHPSPRHHLQPTVRPILMAFQYPWI